MKKIIFILIVLLLIIIIKVECRNEKMTIININTLNNSSLINEDNLLNELYIPDNLIKVDNIYIKEDVYNAFNNMIKNINNDEDVKIVSGYRSYDYQKNLFIKEDNISNIKSVMPPGASEHQSGLAIDISINKLNYLLDESLDESNTYKWLVDNSYKYNFIVRYKKDKINYTSVIYEPWHLRYVDSIVAEICYNKNWCLEELYDYLHNNKLIYKNYVLFLDNKTLKIGEIVYK